MGVRVCDSRMKAYEEIVQKWAVANVANGILGLFPFSSRSSIRRYRETIYFLGNWRYIRGIKHFNRFWAYRNDVGQHLLKVILLNLFVFLCVNCRVFVTEERTGWMTRDKCRFAGKRKLLLWMEGEGLYPRGLWAHLISKDRWHFPAHFITRNPVGTQNEINRALCRDLAFSHATIPFVQFKGFYIL